VQLPCPTLPDLCLSAAPAAPTALAVARPRRAALGKVMSGLLTGSLGLAGLLASDRSVQAAPPPAAASAVAKAEAMGSLAGGAMVASADVAILTEMAQSWLAGRLDRPPASLQVQAPDARWRRPPCRQALQFDLPFPGSTATLRARCAEPVWQVYLRVSGPGLPAAGGTGAGMVEAGRPTDVPAGADALAWPTAPGAGRGPSPTAAAPTPATAAVAWRTVLVAAQPLRRGQVLSPELIQPGQRPAREVDATALTDLRQPGDHELVRDLAPGEVLRAADLRPALMVRRGQVVWLRVGEGSGFVVSARVEALQDGRLGEPVTLRNPDSGQTVSGVVVGPQAVRGGAR
jgi:flagellar basal body P-ring formation protein FlgA